MPKKKENGASAWVDPDDAAELDDDFFDRAELRHSDKVIRPGRPPLGTAAKTSITLRLDPEIVLAYRAMGEGWQSRINADLRRVLKLGKVAGRQTRS